MKAYIQSKKTMILSLSNYCIPVPLSGRHCSAF